MQIFHIERDLNRPLEDQKKELSHQYKNFNYFFSDGQHIHFMAEEKDNDEEFVTVGCKTYPMSEIENLYYSPKKYFATYSAIHTIDYSGGSKAFYVRQIYSPIDKSQHFTKRGQVLNLDSKEVNEIVGFELLNYE